MIHSKIINDYIHRYMDLTIKPLVECYQNKSIEWKGYDGGG